MNKRKAGESIDRDEQIKFSAYSFDDIMVLINNSDSSRLNEVLENIEDINSRNDDSLLMRACKVGNIDSVKALLSRGADVFLISRSSGHSALSLACLYGYEVIVKLLLAHGADPNIPNGRLPLVEACSTGSLNVVDILLDHGAQIDQSPRPLTNCKVCKDLDGEPHYNCLNPLFVACQSGNLALVRLLIGRGAIVNFSVNCDESMYLGYSPLAFASKGYHWDVVKLLVANGADLNGPRGRGKGFETYHLLPLMCACVQGNVNIVKELVDHLGADINDFYQSDKTYRSPLISACTHGHLNIVEFILTHDKFTVVDPAALALVQPGDSDPDEDFPYDEYWAFRAVLHAFVAACQNRDLKVIEVFRHYIPDLDSFVGTAQTPLVVACEQGLTEAIGMLLELGANINLEDSAGNTVLTLASNQLNVPVVQYLLARGASTDARNGRGQTALSALFEDSYLQDYTLEKVEMLLQVITLLVEHGANVNTVDNKGNSVLMLWIVEDGCVPAIKQLLDYGADVSVKNRKGKSAFGLLSNAVDFSRDDDDEDRLNYLSEVKALCKQYLKSNRQVPNSEPLLK